MTNPAIKQFLNQTSAALTSAFASDPPDFWVVDSLEHKHRLNRMVIPDEELVRNWCDFWLPIITDSQGLLNPTLVATELYDYNKLIDNVTKVYEELTGLTKPFTDPTVIISLAEQSFKKYHRDGAECAKCGMYSFWQCFSHLPKHCGGLRPIMPFVKHGFVPFTNGFDIVIARDEYEATGMLVDHVGGLSKIDQKAANFRHLITGTMKRWVEESADFPLPDIYTRSEDTNDSDESLVSASTEAWVAAFGAGFFMSSEQ